MTDDSLFLIDVDKILRTKAPKQYKYIPKFVISYLKKIVHQDEINVFLNESKDKVGVDFLEACMDFLDAKVDVKGIETCLKTDCTPLCQSSVGRAGRCRAWLCVGAAL